MKKVLCIGSVTCDIIVRPIDALPPPGVLQSVEHISLHVGGCAANASIDLGKLGVPVTLSCKVGRDIYGDFVRSCVRESGVGTKGIVTDEANPTTLSIVCVGSDGERSFLYQPGSAAAFQKEDIADGLLQKHDLIFVAGAMLLTAFDGKPCAEVLKKARAMGKYTIMDTAWDFADVWLPKIIDAIPHLDLFMPSYEEAAKLTGKTEPDAIADVLFSLGAKNVIVKLGKQGAYVCPQGQERTVLPTYTDIRPVDTTGAGDSFCAGFLAGLAQGWDYITSGQFANAVGTHCIREVGASTGIKSIQEILDFMNHHPI